MSNPWPDLSYHHKFHSNSSSLKHEHLKIHLYDLQVLPQNNFLHVQLIHSENENIKHASKHECKKKRMKTNKN